MPGTGEEVDGLAAWPSASAASRQRLDEAASQ
jgi:hypothetical protein